MMNTSSENEHQGKGRNKLTAPSISLPKGGGAIRSIGEKFATNPVTGTSSMTVPIATSPGRSGFGPQLSLSYDSGTGNGPFGLGWNLSLTSITLKTDKGLPRYQDADESDVFILSGAEDLVPVLVQNEADEWVSEAVSPRTIGVKTYQIQRYRPRIEGLFARIERWTDEKTGESHWRSISKENVTTIYGKDNLSRIFDPNDPNYDPDDPEKPPIRIFSWLICESYDDKGNAIVYEYVEENENEVDLAQANERNRVRTANRYLKRIKYGNLVSRLVQSDLAAADWMFEVVFDYGDHVDATPTPHDDQLKDATGAAQYPWPSRPDPFSSYRAGFEVRTYRLCRRVLMFHHFPGEEGVGQDCLVRSTDFRYADENSSQPSHKEPRYSKLCSVTQTGYKRSNDSYITKSLPPLEFEYSQVLDEATLQEQPIESIDATSIENLPVGLGAGYQWVDLDGEGISGILTEQATAWFYKPNLGNGRFGPLETVAVRPSLADLNSGRQQLLDLAGDGQLDLATFDGPTPGFYERTHDEQWATYKPFVMLPTIDWSDPNLRFVDLTGDGHADVLITEDRVFTWHLSLAEAGFDCAQRTVQALDEEQGPRLVFNDGTQSIYLTDMSGDGLVDLARIRNGEICYWPNLGYGRFGKKVTMDGAPWFDAPDLFDQRRIRLADIDGSGTTDIFYLAHDGVDIYRNESGNRWTQAIKLTNFARVDNLSDVRVVDLTGNGTACLVWSSSLQGDARQPLRYIDLMAGQKPYLLVKTVNNLGAETVVQYTSSTKFYLQDKAQGKPWITKLPFPVHVVEKVTVHDKWRETTFSTTYSYHHGYFDGHEREFRGFGRVEQIDVEDYGIFAAGNVKSPYITDDQRLFQPPVKTVTWFHTGAFLDRNRILDQFADEYFLDWFERLKPGQEVLGDFREHHLPEPDLGTQELSAEEWEEALRACKGMTLRQEVYELDVDALVVGEERPVKLFTTAYHNCHIQRLQPRVENNHGVFLATESEAITYHYELDLTREEIAPDPRIAHTLNLQTDEYGNIEQAVSVVYPRFGTYEDETLSADVIELIQHVQRELHVTYTETRYTNDVANDSSGRTSNQPDLDSYRLRLPYEVQTYEVTGIKPKDAGDTQTPDKIDDLYFTLDELRAYKLSDYYQDVGDEIREIAYHELPSHTAPQKRLIEQTRTLYCDESLDKPLPLGKLNALGLPYEEYTLALTDELLSVIYSDKLTTDVQTALSNKQPSGYLSGAELEARFGSATAGQYWICSGVAGFHADAVQHFYLPERYTDPFGNPTTLTYDPNDLYIQSSVDAMQNRTEVIEFDFRVLAPRKLRDINDNLSEVRFDLLGMPTVMAVMGKGDEGDSLTGFDDVALNPNGATLNSFFVTDDYSAMQAKALLGNASARHVYYFGEIIQDGEGLWGKHPACACTILREQHVTEQPDSPVQSAFEYSDGGGNVLVKKVQAEPEEQDGPLRWVASGKTILNNKGKPVKQYEPYFSHASVGHRFEEPAEVGETPTMFYDALGRLMRTESPDHSYSRVEFSPWHIVNYDANDTLKEPGNLWFAEKSASTASPEERRVARLAAEHANTPGITLLDTLGREVLTIEHNRTGPADAPIDEKYVTFTKLDAEGKPLWVQDARGNLVMQYVIPPLPDGIRAFNDSNNLRPQGVSTCYDIAGNLLCQHSMDAGDRWMLNDAAGEPMYAWNSRGFITHVLYDALHRPTASVVTGIDPQDPNRAMTVTEKVYGDTVANASPDAQFKSRSKELNLRGQLHQQRDGAGELTHVAYDFKGNLLRSTRQLVADYKQTPDWSQMPTLEDEQFTSCIRYDALNRPVQSIAPSSSMATPLRINVTQPTYNEAGLLERIDLWLEEQAEPDGLLTGEPDQPIVTNINYNAKGQRELIQYGNGAKTVYTYETKTFRLQTLETTRERDGAVLQNLNYTYDPVGNIMAIRDHAQQKVFFRNHRVEPHAEYIYDALYRLVAATGREHLGQNAGGALNPPTRYNHTDVSRVRLNHPGDGQAMGRYTETYGYDAVGNILVMAHKTESGQWQRCYQYANESNRLLSTGAPTEHQNLDDPCPPHYGAAPLYTEQYSYDLHGNMTTMPHLPIMRWDFQDQLQATSKQAVNASDCTPELTYYVYDANGERVRKVTERHAPPGRSARRREERLYLGGFEVYRRYEGDGETCRLERETLHIMDDKQRIGLVESRTLDTAGNDPAPQQLIRYQFGNHLGSASLELDKKGQIIFYEEYAPYGSTTYLAVRSQTDTPKRYRYTGKERDEESGLYYHGMRYYISWLGRWHSCDRAGLVEGTNLYWYSQNAPVMRTDQTGNNSKIFEPHVRGDIGELNLSQAFDDTGRFEPLAFDPSLSGSQSGGGKFDMAVFDRDSKQVLIIDNKAYGSQINEVSSFSKGNFERNLNILKEQLRTSGNAFDSAALDAIIEGRYSKVVTNAYSKGNVGFSKQLFDAGINALDIRTGNLYTDFVSYNKDVMALRKEAKAMGEVLADKRVIATAEELNIPGGQNLSKRVMQEGSESLLKKGAQVLKTAPLVGFFITLATYDEADAYNLADNRFAEAILGETPIGTARDIVQAADFAQELSNRAVTESLNRIEERDDTPAPGSSQLDWLNFLEGGLRYGG